jgi:hypothetical protein
VYLVPRLRKMRHLATLVKRRPLACGVAISTVKTSVADLVVQMTIERRERIDWRRNAVFASFGALWLGGVQYYLYCHLMPSMFPSAVRFNAQCLRRKLKDTVGQRQVLMQTAVDQLVHIPLFYFPTFYVLKASILAGTVSLDVARDAVRQYTRVAWSDNLAQWTIFLPASLFNFGFSPLHLRVPVVAAVSFLWTMVLSFRRGGIESHNE